MATPTFPPQLVGVVQGLAGLLLLAFLRPALANRDTVGSRSFAVFTVGTAVWLFGFAGGNLTSDYTLSVLAWQCVMLGAEVTAVAWFMLALEVTDRTDLARTLLPGIVAVVTVSQLVSFTNPVHHLYLGPETSIDGVFLRIDYGIAFWVHYGLTYLFALAAEAILVAETIRTTGLRRRQALLFALAAVPVILADLLTFFTDIFDPYNVTAFGYVVTAGFLVLVLFRGRFLDITPVARRTAMAEMNDAMVTVDETNRVVDANGRARELFDIDEDYVGMQAADFFAPLSAETLATFWDESVTTTEIAVDIAETTRHFSITISPIGGGTSRGSVVLLHDITGQKHREAELHAQNERLDKFASVVSHDLRNPLGIAQTYLDFAESTGDADDFEATREALDRMDTMIDELLTMARADTVVEDPDPVELDAIVTEAWTTVQTGDATIETADITGQTVLADRELLRNVLENLFRNSVEHNSGAVAVRVGALEDGFYVADDGTGIPPDKRDEIFEYGYTENADGTGFGLSIVEDIVTAHEWEIDITEASSGGARFEIRTATQSI